MSNKKKLTKRIKKMQREGDWDDLYTVFADFIASELWDNIPETKKQRKAMVEVFNLYSNPAMKKVYNYVYD